MRNIRNRLSKYFILTLLLTGVMLLTYPMVKNFVVQYLAQMNLQKINEEVDISGVTYDFENIKSVTMSDVIKATSLNLPVIGEIEVPSVDLHLPVIEGVSNGAMTVGASTLKPGQVMGTGNYALASHHMKNPNLLFSPLDRVEIGAEIFLSDGETTYRYIVAEKRVIEASESYVIEDQVGRKLVTLITCNSNGKKRLLVVGELTQK